jgi:hypothetical protein
MDKFKNRFVLPAPGQIIGESLDRCPMMDKPKSEAKPDNSQQPSKDPQKISVGDKLIFIACKKGKKWKFKVKDGARLGALQADSSKPDDLADQAEYLLEIKDTGNAKNKGMVLIWHPDNS